MAHKYQDFIFLIGTNPTCYGNYQEKPNSKTLLDKNSGIPFISETAQALLPTLEFQLDNTNYNSVKPQFEKALTTSLKNTSGIFSSADLSIVINIFFEKWDQTNQIFVSRGGCLFLDYLANLFKFEDIIEEMHEHCLSQTKNLKFYFNIFNSVESPQNNIVYPIPARLAYSTHKFDYSCAASIVSKVAAKFYLKTVGIIALGTSQGKKIAYSRLNKFLVKKLLNPSDPMLENIRFHCVVKITQFTSQTATEGQEAYQAVKAATKLLDKINSAARTIAIATAINDFINNPPFHHNNIKELKNSLENYHTLMGNSPNPFKHLKDVCTLMINNFLNQFNNIINENKTHTKACLRLIKELYAADSLDKLAFCITTTSYIAYYKLHECARDTWLATFTSDPEKFTVYKAQVIQQTLKRQKETYLL